MAFSEEPSAKVGQKLRELRLSRGLSLREAARHLAISYSRLSDFEEGRTHSTGRPALPGVDVLSRAADLFGYPAQTLLAMAGFGLAEGSDAYRPSATDADVAEIAAVYRRLPACQQRLLLEVVRAFDRSALAP